MLQETDVKYLAGMLDADGCLTLQLKPSTDGFARAYLKLSLFQADVTDKVGLIESLPKLTGVGRVVRASTSATCTGNSWEVWVISDLNTLLPRLTKHMVIKARHWQWLHQLFHSLRNVPLDEAQCEQLRLDVKNSRANNAGPLAPKNHPTWAWMAGFMDGDGHYTLDIKPLYQKGKWDANVVRCGATLHQNDRVALDLLKKAFGGSISQHSPSKPHILKWHLNLGPRNRSLAQNLLPKLVPHAKLKRWKIEQILAWHNQPQRLTEQTSTEEVIV